MLFPHPNGGDAARPQINQHEHTLPSPIPPVKSILAPFTAKPTPHGRVDRSPIVALLADSVRC